MSKMKLNDLKSFDKTIKQIELWIEECTPQEIDKEKSLINILWKLQTTHTKKDWEQAYTKAVGKWKKRVN